MKTYLNMKQNHTFELASVSELIKMTLNHVSLQFAGLIKIYVSAFSPGCSEAAGFLFLENIDTESLKT